MGRRSRDPLLALLATLLAGCLVIRPAPDLPAPEPVREVRRRTTVSGSLESEVSLLVWPDGRRERDGPEREYHAHGGLRAERFFERGAPGGVWRTWYADGTLRSELRFADETPGVPSTSRFWHPDGRTAAEGPTRSGVREGRWSFFDAAGRLERTGLYRLGRRDGPWTFFDASGVKRAEGSYALGQRVGTWTFWNARGEPEQRPASRAELDEVEGPSVPVERTDAERGA